MQQDVARVDLFTAVDETWYEDIGRCVITSELIRISRNINLHSKFVRSGVWMNVVPSQDVSVSQGWKIHISSIDSGSESVLKIVSKICFARSVKFKFICDRRLLGIVNSKMWPRQASGKFIAIYPKDIEEFLDIGKELDRGLSEYKGPHILSDRKFGTSDCVYYRFGGFEKITKIQADGSKLLLVRSKQGQLVPDERNPYFTLPEGIVDPVRNLQSRGNTSPFKNPQPPASNLISGKICIANRFVVQGSMAFTAAGGIYRALDLENNNQEIVLKEARKGIGRTDSYLDDSVSLLEQEYGLLVDLKDTGVTPIPIEICWDSGKRHRFLAIEHIKGMGLGPLLIGLNPIFRAQVSIEDIATFRRIVTGAWNQLAIAMNKVHDHGICIGDMAITNVIVEEWEQVVSLRIIDLEGGWREGEVPRQVFTPGFAHDPLNFSSDKRDYSDDVFSLGRTFFACLLPVTSFSMISTTGTNRLFQQAASEIGLSQETYDFIQRMTASEKKLRPNSQEVADHFSESCWETSEVKGPAIPYQSELSLLIRKASNHILESGDITRANLVFPADRKAHLTNGISLSYGVCGVLHTLNRIGTEIPEKYLASILTQEFSPALISPGLYSGSAGAGLTMLELGYTDFGISILLDASEHSLCSEDPFLFGGASGVGLACLWAYIETKDDRLLYSANMLALGLLNTVQGSTMNDALWKDSTGKTPLGLLNGIAGISLFLLYIWRATDKDEYRELGELILKKIVENKIVPDNITTGHDYWTFSTYAGERKMLRGYWADGSSGIGSVLIRWYYSTGQIEYLNSLKKILPDTQRSMTIFPSMFMGMSGIGMFHLEMHKFLGRTESLEYCRNLVNKILLYQVSVSNGVAFPGDQLQRFSLDFATGTGGILTFLSDYNSVGSTLPGFGLIPTPDELLSPSDNIVLF